MLNNRYDRVGTYTGVVALAVLSLPPALPTAGILGWRRKAAGTTRPWRTSITDVRMVRGTVPRVWTTLLPGNEMGKHGVVSLVPLADLLSMDWGQVVGNLLIFAALGFFAPLRFEGLASPGRVLTLAAGILGLKPRSDGGLVVTVRLPTFIRPGPLLPLGSR